MIYIANRYTGKLMWQTTCFDCTEILSYSKTETYYLLILDKAAYEYNWMHFYTSMMTYKHNSE